MAEAFLRSALGGRYEVFSAGSRTSGYVHPMAVSVLREIGVDISAHFSKPLTEYLGREISTVITVCGHADQVCPAFPGQLRRYHWAFDDPAHAEGSEADVAAVFRLVRDQIKMVFTAYAAGLIENQDAPKGA
jgi:arsenate reductase